MDHLRMGNPSITEGLSLGGELDQYGTWVMYDMLLT